ncbi:uncharacterized protein [Musca autumnalis]|uniref:uncharacterized protein n=1 Tax=Musca autumnalis TaxID=221902 RepID=UPI003CEF963D
MNLKMLNIVGLIGILCLLSPTAVVGDANLETQLEVDAKNLNESQIVLTGKFSTFIQRFDQLGVAVHEINSQLQQTNNPMEKCDMKKVGKAAGYVQLTISDNDDNQKAKLVELSQNIDKMMSCESGEEMELLPQFKEKLAQFVKLTERLQSLEIALTNFTTTANEDVNGKNVKVTERLTATLNRLNEQEEKLQQFEKVENELKNLATKVKVMKEKRKCSAGTCLRKDIILKLINTTDTTAIKAVGRFYFEQK